MSACLNLIFSDVTLWCCVVSCLFWASDVLVWFLAIRRRRMAMRIDIICIYGYVYVCMISPRYVPRYIILCYGYLVRWQAWRFCVAGWLPLS